MCNPASSRVANRRRIHLGKIPLHQAPSPVPNQAHNLADSRRRFHRINRQAYPRVNRPIPRLLSQVINRSVDRHRTRLRNLAQCHPLRRPLSLPTGRQVNHPSNNLQHLRDDPAHNPVYYHPRIHQVLHRQNHPEHLLSLRFLLHGLPVNFPRANRVSSL